MKNSNKAFTLIETIVAISILSVAILGCYMIFSDIYNQSGGAANGMIASYLAQEGIEIVRNIRDDNWIKFKDWRCGLVDVEDLNPESCKKNCLNGCQADYKTGTGADLNGLTPYPEGGNFLKINIDGLYSNDPGQTETIFKRKIIIEPQQENYILKVLSVVYWEYMGKEFSVQIDEYLYDWY